MALTFDVVEWGVSGNERQNTVDITFDSSYPTGGEAITPLDVGLKSITSFQPERVAARSFSYDRTNAKLLAYAGGTEVSNATDLSAVTVRVIATGK